MNEILCPECGHTINWHSSDKCHDTLADDTTCKCPLTPQDIAARLLEKAKNTSFFGGLSTALGTLHMFDQPVIYDEIMGTMNTESVEMLIKHSKENDEFEWTGLDEYLERHPIDPRTPAQIVDDVYAAEVEATRASDYTI